MTEFPYFIAMQVQNGTPLGEILDKLEELHIREERTTRNARGGQPYPRFDRDQARAELLVAFPKLSPTHRDNPRNAAALAHTNLDLDRIRRRDETLKTPLERAAERMRERSTS